MAEILTGCFMLHTVMIFFTANSRKKALATVII